MAESESLQCEKVISYMVYGSGHVSSEYEEVSKALKSGYRVVDIISTAGSAGSTYSSVCVTVLLANNDPLTSSLYKLHCAK